MAAGVARAGLHPDIVSRPREPGLGTKYAVEGALLGTRSKLVTTTIVGSGISGMISFAGQPHWSGGSAEFDHWETGQFRIQVAPWENFGTMLADSPLTTVHRMPAKSILVMIGSEDGTVEPR